LASTVHPELMLWIIATKATANVSGPCFGTVFLDVPSFAGWDLLIAGEGACVRFG